MSFTKIPNSLIRLNVSAPTKIVLFYFLSKSETFNFFNYRIIETIGIGENTFYKSIQELLELNFLEKTKVSKNVDGKIQNLIDYQRGEALYSFDFDSNFTKIPNSFFNLDLNSTEKIVYAYILSQSANWKFYNIGIATDLHLTERTVKRCLSTLIAQSLISRHETKITVLQAKQEATEAKIETKPKSEKAKTDVKTDSKAKKCLHYANLIKLELEKLEEYHANGSLAIWFNDTSYSGLQLLLSNFKRYNWKLDDTEFSYIVKECIEYAVFTKKNRRAVLKFRWLHSVFEVVVLPMIQDQLEAKQKAKEANQIQPLMAESECEAVAIYEKIDIVKENRIKENKKAEMRNKVINEALRRGLVPIQIMGKFDDLIGKGIEANEAFIKCFEPDNTIKMA